MRTPRLDLDRFLHLEQPSLNEKLFPLAEWQGQDGLSSLFLAVGVLRIVRENPLGSLSRDSLDNLLNQKRDG